MIRTLLIATVTLLLTLPSASLASLEILEYAEELPAADIKLPASSAGQLVYRECASCEPAIWQVSANTQYQSFIPAEPGEARIVTLAEFRRAFKSGQAEGLIVFYDPSTNIATRLILGKK